MITKTEVKEIYASHGVWMSSKDAEAVTAQCNENGDMMHRGLNAHQWAVRWAKEEAAEGCGPMTFSERLEYDFSQN